MTDPQYPPQDCSCDHGHDHAHEQKSLPLDRRWLLTVLIVSVLLIILRPFIVGQMLVRVTSYSTNSSYSDAIRICKRIIVIDPNNIQAWDSLGYVYMDSSQVGLAIKAFEQVLLLNPDDKGAASFELGQAYYLKGEFGKAILYFERVRNAGPRAAALLDADILKYRHGTLGFRSLNSMQTLLGVLLESYKKTGDVTKAAEIEKEYDISKSKHNSIRF